MHRKKYGDAHNSRMATPTTDTPAMPLVLHPFVVRMIGARLEEARALLLSSGAISRHTAARLLICNFDLDMERIARENQGKIFEDDDAVPIPHHIANTQEEMMRHVNIPEWGSEIKRHAGEALEPRKSNN